MSGEIPYISKPLIFVTSFRNNNNDDDDDDDDDDDEDDDDRG